MPETEIRLARKSESPTIAELFLISSDGLAAYIWSRLAEPGEALAAVGARRYARDGVAFSYRNCLVAAEGEAILGMAHSFPMERDENAAPETDPVLRPYSELEDYGSLYLSGLALLPTARGRGLGRRLMAGTEARAATLGLPRVSLICFERNEGAMRFYRRLGYRELDRRPVVPHPSLHYADGDAVLLAREL
jgi:ribosomal protein S18 acetylase RimI-like enzyme